MSYIPQRGSLAARVADHLRKNPGIELSEPEIADLFEVKLTSVTACLAAAVQYKVLDRVRTAAGKMGYAGGRKLNGNQVDVDTATRVGAVATPATTPAPATAAAAPLAAPVAKLMDCAPAPRPATPAPASPSTTRVLSLRDRLPDPKSLRVSSQEEEELQLAVEAYDSLLSQVGVGQFLVVPSRLGDDVLRVCRAWGKNREATFRVLTGTTPDEMRIQRAA